ncbi:MAG: hypothetical protein WAV38_32255, partial [Xanthobacteraceae bacterium]
HRRFPRPWSIEELEAMTADQPMTAEQAATLKRLAEAAYELEALDSTGQASCFGRRGDRISGRMSVYGPKQTS